MLLGTLVLVCHLAITSVGEKLQMRAREGNITLVINMENIARLSAMTVSTIAHVIPFTMSLTALLLLLFSLWKHLKRMRFSGIRSPDASTKVHVRAMQTVISFLLLFVISFVAQIISMWNSNSLKNTLVGIFC